MKQVSDTYQYIPMPFGAFILKDIENNEDIYAKYGKFLKAISYNLYPSKTYIYLVFLYKKGEELGIIDSSLLSINSITISILNRYYSQSDKKFILVANKLSQNSILLIHKSCKLKYELYFANAFLQLTEGLITIIPSSTKDQSMKWQQTTIKSDILTEVKKSQISNYNLPATQWELLINNTNERIELNFESLQIKQIPSGFLLEKIDIFPGKKQVYNIVELIKPHMEYPRLFVSPLLFNELDKLPYYLSKTITFLYEVKKINRIELALPIVNEKDLKFFIKLTVFHEGLEVIIPNSEDLLIDIKNGNLLPVNLNNDPGYWIKVKRGAILEKNFNHSPSYRGENELNKLINLCKEMHETYKVYKNYNTYIISDDLSLTTDALEVLSNASLFNENLNLILIGNSIENTRILLTLILSNNTDLNSIEIFLCVEEKEENKEEYGKMLLSLVHFFGKSLQLRELINLKEHLVSREQLIDETIIVTKNYKNFLQKEKTIQNIDEFETVTEEIVVEKDKVNDLNNEENVRYIEEESELDSTMDLKIEDKRRRTSSHRIEDTQTKQIKQDTSQQTEKTIGYDLNHSKEDKESLKEKEKWGVVDSRDKPLENDKFIATFNNLEEKEEEKDLIKEPDLNNTSYIKRKSIINNINNLAIKINDLKIDDNSIENLMNSIGQEDDIYKLRKEEEKVKEKKPKGRYEKRITKTNNHTKNAILKKEKEIKDDNSLDYTQEFKLNITKPNKSGEEEVDICTNFEDFLENKNSKLNKNKDLYEKDLKLDLEDNIPKTTLITDANSFKPNIQATYVKKKPVDDFQYAQSEKVETFIHETKEKEREEIVSEIKTLIKENNKCTRSDKNRLLKFLGRAKYEHHLEAITIMFSKYPTLSKMKDNKRGQEMLANLSIIYGYVNGDFIKSFHSLLNLKNQDDSLKELISSSIKCTENSLKFLSVYSGISIHSIPFDVNIWNQYKNKNMLYEIVNLVANGCMKSQSIVYLIYSHCSHRINLLVHNKHINNITIFHASTYYEVIYKKFDEYQDSAIIGLVDTKSIDLKKMNRDEVIKHMIQIYNTAQKQNFLFDTTKLPTNYPIGLSS